MNRQEWLKWRGIGSSDAPVIMKVSPWKTPLQLWQQKITMKEDGDSFAMKRGRDMEDTARKSFETKIGVSVFAKPLEHPSISFMTATVDGIDLDGKVLVEIKCPGKEDHSKALNGHVPEKYYPQLQHQLEVTGLDGMYYYSFDGRDGVIVEVLRDQKYIEKLLQEEASFHKAVVDMVEPELCERDWTLVEDEQWTSTASAWRGVYAQLKSIEEEEEKLRKALIGMAAGRNSCGAGVRLTKSIARGSVDYSKVPELKSVDLESFRKSPITKWRLAAI